MLLAAQTAAAQQALRLQPSLGLDLITGTIEGATAETQGTGSRAWGMHINMGVTGVL